MMNGFFVCSHKDQNVTLVISFFETGVVNVKFSHLSLFMKCS